MQAIFDFKKCALGHRNYFGTLQHFNAVAVFHATITLTVDCQPPLLLGSGKFAIGSIKRGLLIQKANIGRRNVGHCSPISQLVDQLVIAHGSISPLFI